MTVRTAAVGQCTDCGLNHNGQWCPENTCTPTGNCSGCFNGAHGWPAVCMNCENHGKDLVVANQPSSCTRINLNGRWKYQEDTVDGKGYYEKHVDRGAAIDLYLYYDNDCDGDWNSNTVAPISSWFVGYSPPSTKATSNLHGSGWLIGCQHVAKLEGAHDKLSASPPLGIVEWFVDCGYEGNGYDAWGELSLTFSIVTADVSPPSTLSPPRPVALQRAERWGGVLQPRQL